VGHDAEYPVVGYWEERLEDTVVDVEEADLTARGACEEVLIVGGDE